MCGVVLPEMWMLQEEKMGFPWVVVVTAVGVDFSPLLLTEFGFVAARIEVSGNELLPNCEFNLFWRNLCHVAGLLTPFEFW